jgi:hypothetical protein
VRNLVPKRRSFSELHDVTKSRDNPVTGWTTEGSEFESRHGYLVTPSVNEVCSVRNLDEVVNELEKIWKEMFLPREYN